MLTLSLCLPAGLSQANAQWPTFSPPNKLDPSELQPEFEDQWRPLTVRNDSVLPILVVFVIDAGPGMPGPVTEQVRWVNESNPLQPGETLRWLVPPGSENRRRLVDAYFGTPIPNATTEEWGYWRFHRIETSPTAKHLDIDYNIFNGTRSREFELDDVPGVVGIFDGDLILHDDNTFEMRISEMVWPSGIMATRNFSGDVLILEVDPHALKRHIFLRSRFDQFYFVYDEETGTNRREVALLSGNHATAVFQR